MTLNMIPVNLSTGSDALGTTSGFDFSGCTIASSTLYAYQGTRSVEMTATVATGNMYLTTSGTGTAGIPVKPSTLYTMSGWYRKNASTTNQARSQLVLRWYTAAGGATTVGGNTGGAYSSDTWQQKIHEYTSPSDAAFVELEWSIYDPTISIGDKHYWDQLSFWEGDSSGTWEATNNLLTLNQQTGTDTSAATTEFLFSACTGASSTTVAYSGARSVATTSTGTGNNFMYCGSGGTSAIPVTGGYTVDASVRFYGTAASAGCIAGPQVYWYDAAGAACSPTYVTESSYQTVVNGSWVQGTLQATAPADAAYMRMAGTMQSGVQTSDVIYWDDFILTAAAPAASNVTYSRRLVIG